MKIAKSYRLKKGTVSQISHLSDLYKTSNSAIIEKAVEEMVNKSKSHPLLKYAGILSDKEANKMLKDIKNNRVNKKNIPKL